MTGTLTRLCVGTVLALSGTDDGTGVDDQLTELCAHQEHVIEWPANRYSGT